MLLLDTDVMVDLLRGYPPAVVWLQSVASEQIGVPGFVAMELVQGCRNRREQRALETELQKVVVLWPSPASCDRALSTFAQFYLSHRVGLLDALIAEAAKGHGAVLHTFNEKHYRPIPSGARDHAALRARVDSSDAFGPARRGSTSRAGSRRSSAPPSRCALVQAQGVFCSSSMRMEDRFQE